MTIMRYRLLFGCIIVIFISCGRICLCGELIDLDNGWQYRYGDSPVDEAGVPLWIKKDVAVHWRSFSPPFNPPERNKRNFLWLKKNLPASKFNHPTLYLTNVMTDFQVYSNEESIYSFGSFKSNKRDRSSVISWHLIPLKPEPEGYTLYFRIYSTDQDYIGIPVMADNKALFGDHADVLGFVVKNGWDRFVLGCFFMLVGIFSFDAFMHRFAKKPYYLLSFGIFTFFIGLAFALSNDLMQLIFDCSPVRYFGSLLGVVLFPVGFFSFFEYIVLKQQKRTLRVIWQVLLVYGLMIWILDLVNIIHYNTYLFAIILLKNTGVKFV
ncbi:hypothetical protein JW935_22500 [candidate division KSB1 bacterium]|nr:hypothetical protein [candidate division KSB1 bacterium]